MNDRLFEKCIQFHGHECPGLAIGFRACEIAANLLKISFSKDEEIVCVSENDACGVDAIQFITGCTIGKGNLILRNRGKMAFSFFIRENAKSVRLVLKPSNKEMSRDERKEYILNAPQDEVFEIKKPSYSLPKKAQLFKTIVCEKCNEGASENNIRLKDNKRLCLDCYEEYKRGW